jgi:menaquinone reductase, multiheme cytochrome c subunit
MDSKPLLMFPKWSNRAAVAVLIGAVVLPLYLGILLVYGANPTTLNTGYQPIQPVPYSHALHAGKLGIDCRYCHTTVEKAAFAALPPTDVCMNCHKEVLAKSPKLAPVFKSYAEGTPVPWIKVHGMPDYVYFNHSAHVTAGVGCAECHGPVHQMEVVYNVRNLSMSWCLECHRDPGPLLRPKEEVTHMDWVPPGGNTPEAREAMGRELVEKHHIYASTDCTSTCHR